MNADRVTDEAVKAAWYALRTTVQPADSCACDGDMRAAINAALPHLSAADAVRDVKVSDVTAQLIARDQAGLAKYGTTLDRKDLSLADWLQHMSEELLDAAGYALAAKAAAVPDGWQLVPKVPTAEMRAAFQGDGMHGMSKTTVFIGDFDARYSDTLAAAPSPQEAT